MRDILFIKTLTISICLILAQAIPSIHSAHAKTIYVDEDAKGLQDGTNWKNAFHYLNDALSSALAKDTIWVAEGTYYPDESKAYPQGTGNRTDSFYLINDVRILGGFDPGSGADTYLERDFNAHPTVLSGNISDRKKSDDNSYHVIQNLTVQNATAVLDGFIITEGNADGNSFPDNVGGGIYNGKTSPTISHCIIRNNFSGHYGGGVYIDYSTSNFSNCRFEENTSDVGGGLYTNSSEPGLTDCLFKKNSAPAGSGGAVYNNTADGIFTNIQFIENSASYGGGGIYNYGGSKLAIYNCTFNLNTASYGGGIHNADATELVMINCSSYRNSASTLGGSIFSRNNSAVTMYNCLLWNDIPQEIYNDNASLQASYSDIEMLNGAVYPGTGNINKNPMIDSRFHLSFGSPCINQGDTGKVPPFLTEDFEGDPRIHDENVDMGADEYTGDAVAGVINPLDTDQLEGIEKLKNEIDPDNFKITLVRGGVERLELNLESVKPSTGYSPDTFAAEILGQYPTVFGLENPAIEFRLRKRVGGDQHVLIFDQYYKNIPVYGAWIKMNIEDKFSTIKLKSLSGNYTPDISIGSLTPGLSEMKAFNLLKDNLNIDDLNNIHLAVPTKLWIFDDGLRNYDEDCGQTCSGLVHNPKLVWRIIYYNCKNNGALADAFIDAATGEIIRNTSRVYYDDPKIRISSAMGNSSSVCFAGQRHTIDAWFDQDGICATEYWCSHPKNYCHWDGLHCANPDAEGFDCYNYSWDLYDFYYDLFGRRSYDGGSSGKKMWMFLDVGFSSANASSNDCGSYRVHFFSSGMATLDIMGHEFAHSVHDEEANFVYEGQSGAIAEHIADMFGHFVGFWTGIDPDWMHGEDGSGADASGCGRDMENPGNCDQPESWHDRDFPTPDGDNNDNGRVHHNSGILNRAGYLMVEGGVDGHVTVVGIGEEKARRIYYETVKRLSRNPSFRGFADNMVDTCESLIGDYGITETDCCQVRNSFAAVEIPYSYHDTDCDGDTDAWDDDDDGDGIHDSLDNCRRVFNPRQENHDSDWPGDACDEDADDDGILNDDDDCPLTPGVGDVCIDTDGDGIMNAFDNCSSIYNPEQSDIDSDGIGNPCDPDIDGDGRLNDSDNCRYTANSDQANSDGDFYGDVCDNCPFYGASSDQRDFDGDGMGDVCDDDIDNDGYNNDVDECDYEAVPSTSGLAICPPDHFCRVGCNPQRNIEINDFELMFNIDAARPIAELQPSLTIPLDICALIPCEESVLLDDHDFISLNVAAALDRSSMSDLIRDNPLNLSIAIIDEAGVSVANADMNFLEGTHLSETLQFQMSPAFTMRENEQIPLNTPLNAAIQNVDASQNALPSYYLAISLQFENDFCMDKCMPCRSCENSCEDCQGTCGHCGGCSACKEICDPCITCEQNVKMAYAAFFDQKKFHITTGMTKENLCDDGDDDEDTDGKDLVRYALKYNEKCLGSFADHFGKL